MNTNFFRQINAMQVQGDWKIAIRQDGAGGLIVSILLTNEKAGDEAHKLVPPMIFRGTAKEIDEGVFDAMTAPAQKTSVLFANMEHYMKQLDEAKVQSKMEQDRKDKDKKDRDERRKKYQAAIKRVDELEEKKQYQEAFAAMPAPDQFPEHTDDIIKRLDELRAKTGQLTLM